MGRFETASSGNQGLQGPYLDWRVSKVKGTNIQGNCFVLSGRTDGPPEQVGAAFVVDIDAIRMGWKWHDAMKKPHWKWAAPGQYTPGPKPEHITQYDGDKGWQSGFAVPVFVTVGQEKVRGLWSQSQRSAVSAFTALLRSLDKHAEAQEGSGMLPVLKLVGVEEIDTGQANSMNVPTLDVAKWITRPDGFECIDPVGVAPAETAPAPARFSEDPPQGMYSDGASAAHPSTAAQAPLSADLDDEIPF